MTTMPATHAAVACSTLHALLVSLHSNVTIHGRHAGLPLCLPALHNLLLPTWAKKNKTSSFSWEAGECGRWEVEKTHEYLWAIHSMTACCYHTMRILCKFATMPHTHRLTHSLNTALHSRHQRHGYTRAAITANAAEHHSLQYHNRAVTLDIANLQHRAYVLQLHPLTPLYLLPCGRAVLIYGSSGHSPWPLRYRGQPRGGLAYARANLAREAAPTIPDLHARFCTHAAWRCRTTPLQRLRRRQFSLPSAAWPSYCDALIRNLQT